MHNLAYTQLLFYDLFKFLSHVNIIFLLLLDADGTESNKWASIF